jgi:hypothetical protein
MSFGIQADSRTHVSADFKKPKNSAKPKPTYSSAAIKGVNFAETEKTEINKLRFLLATALQDIETAKNRDFYAELKESKRNVKGLTKELAESNDVIASLSAKVDAFSKKEEELQLKELANMQNIQKPTNSDMMSGLKRANQVIQEMSLFTSGIETLCKETYEASLNKAKLEDLQLSLAKYDPQYEAFSKSYKGLKPRIEEILGELNLNIGEANKFQAIPVYIYPTISAQLLVPSMNIKSDIQGFNDTLSKSKETAGKINEGFSKINNILNNIKTNLNNIDHHAVVLRDNVGLKASLMHYGDKYRLSPLDADFLVEKKVEVTEAAVQTV